MRIERVESRAVFVPLDVPVAFSTREITGRWYTLVRVLADGLEGIGFCLGSLVVSTAVRTWLKPLLEGQDPFATEWLWDRMYRQTLLEGRRGAVLRAISAVDIALWDLKGKATGLPLYRLLGGNRSPVPAYASGGYYAKGKSPAKLAEEAAGYVAQGFSAVKIKVGREREIKQEVARVAAVREAIGPDVQLFLDANNAWPDAPTAIRYIRAFEPYDIGWIEEPVMPDNLVQSVAVATSITIPVATGEIEATRWGFRAIIEARAAQILQPDAAVCGGVTEWLRIAALAAAFDLQIAPHWFSDLHCHLVAAAPNATWVEYFTDTSILNIWRLVREPVVARDGRILPPDRPGHGIDLDPAAVERFAQERWA